MRNRQASALRGGQSGVIGLIVRDLSAPFYAELTAGLTEALEAQGRMVFLLHGGKDGEQLAQRFSLLLNQGVDGVVIAGAAGSSDDLRRMAEEKAIPVIFASRASYLDDVDTVRPDNMQAAQLLTEHLIRNGHQRIAWLGGQSSSLTRAERVGGYCATLLKFGLPFHSDWVLECTYNETIAMGAWFGLLKAGRQSGESGVDRYFEQQVSLAAFTDATPTTLDDIPVTWASTPARELGITLADRMMQKITHEETHSRNLIIPARLIAPK